MNKELKEYIMRREKELEKQRLDYMREHGIKPFYKFPKGETAITLVPKTPRAAKSPYGIKEAFRIKVDDVEYDWSINPQSPMFRVLLAGLKVAPVTFKVVKTGEGKQTRFDITEVQ